MKKIKNHCFEMPSAPKNRGLRSYSEAVIVELLNPKTALFFLAFLPQFIHPDIGESIVQFLFLGMIFVMMSIAYTSAIALSTGLVTRMIGGSAKFGRMRGILAGVIYILLGLKVAFQSI